MFYLDMATNQKATLN